jgi:anti-anti-sigma factor
MAAPDPGRRRLDVGMSGSRPILASDPAASPRDTDVHVIRLAGELDMAAVPDLVDQLAEAAKVPAPTPVVVDMSGVTFIDCSGLDPLLEARARLDGRLRLQNASPPVRRLLRLLDLTTLAASAEGDTGRAAE